MEAAYFGRLYGDSTTVVQHVILSTDSIADK